MKQKLLILSLFSLQLYNYAQQSKPLIVPVNRTQEIETLRQVELVLANQRAVRQPTPLSRPAPNTHDWSFLCGSMDASGMLYSHQRPLNYSPALDAISFIHKKSASYTETPDVPLRAESGVIVAELSTNWGATWDSTCLYSNATEWGRSPQGAIVNPSGNTNLANAFVVGCGPTMDTLGFSGNWYASKSLNVFDNMASVSAGAQQFYSSRGNLFTSAMNRHGFSRSGFSVTNDGLVHALGIVGSDLSGTSSIRGYAVLTGTFNGSAVVWKMDSIIPPAVIKTGTQAKHLQEGQMVWNPAGTVGYVVGIGVRSGATQANRSYQPIIYKCDKTTDPAATWTLTNQLDFTNTFTAIGRSLTKREISFPAPTGSTSALPFTYDFDLSIDADNALHLGIIFMSGYSDHPDSLEYYVQHKTSTNPTEGYRWPHAPNYHPYIYDFIGNGFANWKSVLVDSMCSEAPGIAPGQAGYDENPWDTLASGKLKLPMENRLQLGRTPDGRFITFTWSESDTLFTNSGFKYNNLPDVKVRALAVHPNIAPYAVNRFQEIDMTRSDIKVRSRGTFHYSPPVTSASTLMTGVYYFSTVTILMPVTVTNNYAFYMLNEDFRTWFGKNKLDFLFPPGTGLSDLRGDVFALQIYPNPAQQKIGVSFTSEGNSSAEISIQNALGQGVMTLVKEADRGENSLEVDISGLRPGIYLLTLECLEGRVTKKLVIN